jgi:DmsE family decaheme c-type cytochrome
MTDGESDLNVGDERTAPGRRLHWLVGACAGTALLCWVVLTGLLAAPADAQNRMPGAREAQYTADGAENCIRCHGAKNMTIMASTPHGNADNPHTPWAQHGCESCHGPGSVHASRAGGGRGFPPLITFSADEDVERQVNACQSCHANDMGEMAGMHWEGSLHSEAGMGCMDCHQGHSVENPLAQRESQAESCAMCHGKQIKSHPRFENKGIVFDELSCYTCHDVHQLTAVEP